MTVVKIPATLREQLAAMDLVVWSAMHPMDHAYEIAGKVGKGREDKTRVMVQLSGPGLADFSPWGYGGSIQEAVQHALSHPEIIGRVPGLKGAMMRLEAALGHLTQDVRHQAFITSGIYDDEIPF